MNRYVVDIEVRFEHIPDSLKCRLGILCSDSISVIVIRDVIFNNNELGLVWPLYFTDLKYKCTMVEFSFKSVK